MALFPDLGAAAGQLGGTLYGASQGKKMQRRAFKWQQHMRQTAYQDTTEDMRKAGLNPILAFRQGSNATGGAPIGPVPDFGKAGAAFGARPELDLHNLNKDVLKSQISLQQENARKAGAEADAVGPRAEIGKMQVRLLQKLIDMGEKGFEHVEGQGGYINFVEDLFDSVPNPWLEKDDTLGRKPTEEDARKRRNRGRMEDAVRGRRRKTTPEVRRRGFIQ